MSDRPARTGQGLARSVRFALAGLQHALRTQRTFRIQLVCAAVVAVLVIWLRLPLLHAAVVTLALFFVLAAELFNTGVEAIVDLLVERNHHEAARIAKDVAAAGVVTSVVAAVLAGGLLLGPPLLQRVGTAPHWATRIAFGGALIVLVAAVLGVAILLRRPAGSERGIPGSARPGIREGAPARDAPAKGAGPRLS